MRDSDSDRESDDLCSLQSQSIRTSVLHDAVWIIAYLRIYFFEGDEVTLQPYLHDSDNLSLTELPFTQ